MARRYYRVGPAIWLEPWDDDTRYVAFYLLTCRHRNTEGLYYLPLDYGRTDLKWPAKRFRRAFGQLTTAGFVEYDEDAQVVLVIRALEWQAPANPNQVKAAVKAIRELPPTPLLNRFRTIAGTLCEPLAEALTEAFGKPVSNTPSPSPAPQTSSATPALSGAEVVGLRRTA